MKVTISFNGTKIVVPCADGEISVREVTTLAATRYKKAIGKTNSYWVSVASLKSHEGGILDADDLIGDVCDDREQLAAIFDEQNGGHYHGGGDGMSSASDSDTKEIMGGATTCSSENLLQVRRGSEPVLNKGDNCLPPGPSGSSVQAVIASINAGVYGAPIANSHHISRSMSSHAGLAESMSSGGKTIFFAN
jgi:partitioning defective protein 3